MGPCNQGPDRFLSETAVNVVVGDYFMARYLLFLMLVMGKLLLFHVCVVLSRLFCISMSALLCSSPQPAQDAKQGGILEGDDALSDLFFRASCILEGRFRTQLIHYGLRFNFLLRQSPVRIASRREKQTSQLYTKQLCSHSLAI